MREFVLLAGGVGAAIVLTIFLTKGTPLTQQLSRSWSGGGAAAVQSQATAEAEAAAKAEAADKKSVKKRTERSRVTEHLVTGGSTEFVVPMVPEIYKVPPAPFPTAKEMAVGMPRSSVKGKFGEPNFVTVQTQDGVLVERYVYLNRERSLMTLVFLENGRTVRADSRPY